jgi:hypothetical protein
LYLFPNQLLWVKPSHDIWRVADGHRATRVIKHQSEIFSLSDLKMIEDEVNQGRPFSFLVNVENVARIVQKRNLKNTIYIFKPYFMIYHGTV